LVPHFFYKTEVIYENRGEMIKPMVHKITLEIYLFEMMGRDAITKIIITEYISTLAVSFNS